MKFTDIFIKRPVLATVVSLMILLLGLRSISELQIREFPQVENTVITITTSYPGASADVMQGFITSPIQKAIAGAEGLDYLTSSSTQGTSTISANIKLNFNPYNAFTDIMSKVASVQNQLPRDAQNPVITKTTGSQIALMYMGFYSSEMSPGQITDYITRVVQPKLETVSGVASVQILGGKTFAMRIWLDPARMAAHNVTPDDVMNALNNNNFQSAPGQTKGEYVAFNINAKTDLHDATQFQQLVIKSDNGAIVRLQDVGNVELGAQDYDSSVFFNGEQSVFIGINATPTANPLSVISDIQKIFPQIQQDFPPTLKGRVVYDATKYIRSSIHEVIKTITEATVIVIIIIFLFLGALRSVAIPVVTIPLSLIGVCTLMLFLGYSINLLTLLAMVLAIGLVVDDAIVVVENIHRHIEEGMTPFDAAIKGAREIATPVIAMTITLAAVYTPIGFMGGLTGALFKEFAFTLACTVIISGIIALTLSPMMCSKILNANISSYKLVSFIEHNFGRFREFYLRRLHNTLNFRPVMVIVAATVLTSCFFLYMGASKELAPDEDQGFLFVSSSAPQYANIDYTEFYSQALNNIFKSFPEVQDYFLVNGINGPNSAIAGAILKPWNERKRSQQQIQAVLQNEVSQIPGLQTVAISPPSLPVSDGLPIQFAITSIGSYQQIYDATTQLLQDAQKSGLFMFVDSDLKFEQPQIEVNINRDKAAQLGINMQDIGSALATAMGGNYINFFSIEGQSYQVIPQVLRDARLNPDQISQVYVRSANGAMIPLSTVVSLSQTVQPNSLNQFQQLNSATISGVMKPGVSVGDALQFLQQKANQVLPSGMSYDYGGQSRQFIQEGSTLVYTFFFALIVIFLVLSAQFESFRDPLIILISVPMSICGALIPLYLGLATVNIYTQIGLITLIGLISKHGILMVDFANKLQINEGLSVRDAIEKSASIRLRPILMTTAAMVVGVVPLILASGAGAKSRFDIGLVVATGMMIGTIFTLFIVPTMYTFIAKDHSKQNKI